MKKLAISLAIPLFLSVLMAIIFYPVMDKFSQSFKFVDEAEHMVMAWLMDEGYQLYRDFPNNHQPINYFASYLVQHLSKIDNVLMLTRRHRQAIFAWSFIWWMILIKRFGKKAVIPILLFESIKYFTLGNEFLAESLIVYPLAYVITSMLFLDSEKLSNREHYVIGFLTAFVQLTLLPMAITLTFMTLLRYTYLKGKGLGYFILGLMSVVLGVFVWVDPLVYVREMFNAITYSLPGLSPIKSPIDAWRLIGLPFQYFSYVKDIIGQTVIMSTLWWLTALAVYFIKGKKRQAWIVVGAMIAWLLTNTRVIEADAYFYEGFHLTPWLFAGLLGGMISLWQAVKLITGRWKIGILLANSIALLIIFSNSNMPLYAKIDPATEHYVQYTPVTQAAEIINSLKLPEDRLMVIPNESWIYYMTDLHPAPTNMFTFYDWQVQVPRNRYLFFQTLKNTPPTFIVYYDDASSYSPMMNEYLKANYIQLMEYPNVFIHQMYSERLGESRVINHLNNSD